MKRPTDLKPPRTLFLTGLACAVIIAGACLYDRYGGSPGRISLPDPGATRAPVPAALPFFTACLLLLSGGGLLLWYWRQGSRRAGGGRGAQELAEEIRQTMFDETSDAILIHDDDFRIIEANGAAERMLGYDAGELRQMQVQDLFDPDYIRRKPLLIDQILSGTQVFSKRTVIRKDRQAVIIGVKVRRVGPDRLLALLSDITAGHNIRPDDANETLLRNSIDSSAIGICIVGLDGRFLDVNAALGTMTGYSGTELTTRSFQEITHPDDLDRDLAFIEKTRSGAENAYRTEKRYYRKDGSIIWVRVNVATIRDETGEPLHFFAQVEDITELREANNNYRLLVEQSLAGVYIYQDGKFAYVNPRMGEIYGYTQDELLQLPSSHSIVYLEDRPLVLEQIRLRESGETAAVHYETRGIKKTGEVIWTEVFGATTYFNGKPAFIGTVLDITERKSTETAILHEKQLLETVIKSLPGIFYITEPDGRLIRWNDHLLQVLGYTDDELLGKYTTDLIEGGQHEFVLEARARAHKAGKATGEVRIVPKTGETLTYYVCIMPVIYNGQVRTLGIGLDFSEKKKTEAELVAKTAEAEARRAELEAFFESVEGNASLLDNQKRYLIFNKQFVDVYTRLTGHEPQLGGESFHHLDPEEKVLYNRLLDGVMAGRKEVIEETYEIEGKRYFYRTSFSPVLTGSGQVAGISVYSIDLTKFHEAEAQLRRINHELNERVKELRCLYRVSEVINDDEYSIEEMVGRLVSIIPFGWQYPDITCVKVEWAGKQFRSGNFSHTEWNLEAPVFCNNVNVGNIVVCYLTEMPPAAEGPFLREERALIDSIAELVGSAVERRISSEELLKQSRLYQFTSAINEAMLRTADEMSVYKEACGIAVSLGNYRTAWIGSVDAAGERLVARAVAGHDDGRIAAIDIDLADPGLRQGITGMAIHTSTVQYCDDIANDPRMELWREGALQLNFRASIALPILTNNRLVGLFVLYRSEAFSFNEAEIKLLKNITDNIAYAVDNLRSRDAKQVYLEKLSESEEQFRKLTEETPVGVYILQDHKFCYVNPQFEEITGYRKEELLHGFPFDRLIHEDDVASAQKAYLARLEGRSTDGQSVFKGRRADNTIRYIDLITSHIRYQGKPAVIGTVIDITEKVEEEKRFNLAITETQEAERLAIGMELHDNVKQIIATSLLSLYAVKANLDSKDTALQYLNEANAQIREAVAELRKLSHRLAPSVDMSIPFQEKIAALLSAMNVSNKLQIELSFNLHDTELSNPIQLAFYRILQEQLANILKHAEATVVTIKMTGTHELLTLTVADNGIGFDPSATKHGIGLENIRRRASALNGSMHIVSAPDAGCSLTVQVPSQ